MKNILKYTYAAAIFVISLFMFRLNVQAVSYPNLTLEFEPGDQSVIVAGVPAYDATGTVRYEIKGYLNFGEERVESFTRGPEVVPYDIPQDMAYIFNWSDAEFLLPGSGEYVFTAWVLARDATNGFAEIGTSPAVSITFNYVKADESTNWGPGLPNTTVESYDLGQIQGKDKTIIVEETDYTWTIPGMNITQVPEENISLLITANPDTLNAEKVEEFFGETLAVQFAIDYDGDFGFEAILDYKLGEEYAGKYANLFYVSDDTFEFVEGVTVAEGGVASFTFTHASDYIIAVTEEPYTGQELNPKEEESILPEEVPSDEDMTVPGVWFRKALAHPFSLLY